MGTNLELNQYRTIPFQHRTPIPETTTIQDLIESFSKGFDPAKAKNFDLVFFNGRGANPGVSPKTFNTGMLIEGFMEDVVPKVPRALYSNAEAAGRTAVITARAAGNTKAFIGGPIDFKARERYIMENGGDLIKDGFKYSDGGGYNYGLTRSGLAKAQPRITAYRYASGELIYEDPTARLASKVTSGRTVVAYSNLGLFVATWGLQELADYSDAQQRAWIEAQFAEAAEAIRLQQHAAWQEREDRLATERANYLAWHTPLNVASQLATKKDLLAQKFDHGRRLASQWVALMKQGKHDAKLENLLSAHDAGVSILRREIADLEADLRRMESR